MIEMPAQFVSLASGPTPPDRQAECIVAYSRLSITSEFAAGARKSRAKTGVVGRRPSVVVFYSPTPRVLSFLLINRPNELRAWDRLSVFHSWALRKHKLSMLWF